MTGIKNFLSNMLKAIKATGQLLWKKIKAVFVDRSPLAWFLCLLFFSTFIFLVFVLIHGYKTLMEPFFHVGEDMFMDYFNSVRDVSLGEGVYTVRKVIYPPMANLLFLLFLRMVPKEYAATEFALRQTWISHPSAIFSLLIFLIIPVVLLVLLCAGNLKKATLPKKIFGFFAIFNYPVLYMLERGNILIYCLLATAAFVFYYDSESKVKRELALLALAFAFSLKIYPAILGVVLLVDKRYKDAVRCAVYGLLLLLLPSFFFGGPECLVTMLKNITSFADAKNTASQMYIFYLTAVIFLLAAFVQKDKTKLLFFGVAVMRVNPALSVVYAWAFFLPILCVMMNNEQKLCKEKIFYFLLTAIPYCFIPAIGQQAYDNYMAVFLYALLILCVLDTGIALVQTIQERRKAGMKTKID